MPGVWVTLYMLCVYLTVLLLARLWNMESPISVFFTAALLAVNPTVIDQSLLQYMFMSWGISNLFGVCFVYIICRSDSCLARYAAAPVLMAMAFGFYQASVGLITLAFALTLILRLLRAGDIRAEAITAARFIAASLIGAALYFVILKLELLRWGVGESDRVGAFSIAAIFSSLGETLPDAYRFFFAYFDDNIFHRNLYAALLAVLGLAVLVRRVWLTVCERHRTAAALAVVLTALVPAFANICRIIFPYFTVVRIMEYQIMLLFPFFFALAEEDESHFVQTKNAVRILAFAMSLLLVCGYTISANATYRAYDLSYSHARYEAGEIMRRARELPDYEDGETVMLAGFIRDDTLRKTNGVYKYAYSMYDNLIFWEEYMGITSGRRNFMLDTLGIDPGDIDMAEYCRIVESDAFADMPLYPAAGSVARINGVIVAKLSDNPLTPEDLMPQ